MNKLPVTIFFLVIGLAFLYFLFFMLAPAHPSTSSGQATTQVPNLNADAYPLYGNLMWGPVHTSEIESISGLQVDSAPVTNITNLSAVFMPFDAYYANKLLPAGWALDQSLAAGGPGAAVTAYKKGSDYIITSYHTDFKGTQPNQPVQCPCDITFSVFSSTQK